MSEHAVAVQATHGALAEHAHPGPRQYVGVAAVLAIITAAEVAIYYVSIPHTALVATLLIMSAMKFFLVAMWFMHLRFDSKIFRRLFVAGIVLATIVFGIVLLTFKVFIG
jgi:cytochrome c oxidase subunit 4